MNKISWKKVLLACSASMAVLAGSSLATAAVQVTRDELGVPLIEADTNSEMGFALGYVQARDRLIQMEILRQAAFGELPILGSEQEAEARVTRNIKLHHKYPNLRKNLSKEFENNPDQAGKSAMSCMAEGINYFIFHMVRDIAAKKNQPKCLSNSFNPKSLGDTGKHEIGPDEIQYISARLKYLKLKSHDWTPIDIAGLFHLQVMDEFSNRNTELKNLFHLVALTKKHGPEPAVKIFNSIKWALSGNAATTIPATPDKANYAHKMANYYHENLIKNIDVVKNDYNGCTVYDVKNFVTAYGASADYAMHQKDDQFPLLASNWWVVSQPGLHNGIPSGIMYNGPQISALDPAKTYQVALKSKQGFQYAGNTFPGTINFWQGHNGTLSMGLTTGNIDVSDMFCVDVYKDDDGLYYKFGKNNFARLTSMSLQHQINDNGEDDGKVGDEDEDEVDDEESPLQASLKKIKHHLYNVADKGWPVVMIEENNEQKIDGEHVYGTAYIQRYNWEGATVSTLISWMNALNETDLGGWNSQLDTVGANFNMVALNAEGTASYRLTGSLPLKKGMTAIQNGQPPQDWDYYPSYDPRLPAPMAPNIGWTNSGKKYHKLNHTMKNGVFANWNQKPFINMPDGDLDYDSYFRFDRVTLIRNELASQQPLGTWTLEDILDLNGRLQRLDVNYFAYEPFLKRLQLARNPVELQKALSLILQWNGQRGDYRNPKGDQLGAHYGHVLFFEWINALTENVAKVISKDDSDLTKNLMGGLLKTRQPYFPIISDGGPAAPKPTILTSHGIHVNSRIILNALHATFEISASETEIGSGATKGHQYEYDDYQQDLMEKINEGNKNKVNAMDLMFRSLNTALRKIQNYPGFSQDNFNSGEDAYLAKSIRTYSGLSKKLANKDVAIGFRPGDNFMVPHFRNRGPLNIAVAFKNGHAQGKNIAHPGIREYREMSADPAENAAKNWFSLNQMKMYENNHYRDMFVLPNRTLPPQ